MAYAPYRNGAVRPLFRLVILTTFFPAREITSQKIDKSQKRPYSPISHLILVAFGKERAMRHTPGRALGTRRGAGGVKEATRHLVYATALPRARWGGRSRPSPSTFHSMSERSRPRGGGSKRERTAYCAVVGFAPSALSMKDVT